MKISEVAAPNYVFADALVGRFCRSSLVDYFEFVRARFAVSGHTTRKDLSFSLRGPMDKHQFWREAPALGLDGVTTIVAMPKGIVGESVAYDFNMASELLRGASR